MFELKLKYSGTFHFNFQFSITNNERYFLSSVYLTVQYVIAPCNFFILCHPKSLFYIAVFLLLQCIKVNTDMI